MHQLRTTLPRRLLIGVMLALAPAAAPLSAQRAQTVDVFLDCQAPGCDGEHIRSELDWVNWVRDRTAADVHVLITAESAGGGGTAYRLAFLGRRTFEEEATTLNLDVPAIVTAAARRDLLTGRIGQGLVPFAVRTAVADRIRIVHDAQRDDVATAAVPERDAWNNWVFGTRFELSLEGEARESSHELELSFDATRVTANMRLEFDLEASYEEDRFELRSGEQRFTTRNWEVEALAAHALADRWSLGAAIEIGRSTFQNQDFYARPAAVLEFSIYPYDEFSRRRLTVQYSLGGRHAEYAEPTIYGRLREQRFDQELEAAAEFQQPWGSAWTRLTGSHYLHDIDRYRLATELGFVLRLFRGFTLDVSGEYARVHDQLYIPAGDADDDEILLRRRALETNFSYETSIGVRYAFGSIYNNIVNPRVRR